MLQWRANDPNRIGIRTSLLVGIVVVVAMSMSGTVSGVASAKFACCPGGGGGTGWYFSAPYSGGGVAPMGPTSNWLCPNPWSSNGTVYSQNGTVTMGMSIGPESGVCGASGEYFDNLDLPLITPTTSGSYTFVFEWYVNWVATISDTCGASPDPSAGISGGNVTMWIKDNIDVQDGSSIGSTSSHFMSHGSLSEPCFDGGSWSGSGTVTTDLTVSLSAGTTYWFWSAIVGYGEAVGSLEGEGSVSFGLHTVNSLPTHLESVSVTCPC